MKKNDPKIKPQKKLSLEEIEDILADRIARLLIEHIRSKDAK